MKRIKNLDYFRKTEHEKATRSGGIISLLCFAAISYLVYTQYQTFLLPVVKKDTIVAVDMSTDQFVNWEMAIALPSAPCQAFDLILKTGYTYKVNKEIDGLEKIRFNFNTGKALDGELPTLEQALQDGEGCLIKGTTKIRKVPGSLSVSTEKSQWEVLRLLQASGNPELANKLNLEHYFEKFQFNTEQPQDLEQIKTRFKDHPDHLKFDLTEEDFYKDIVRQVKEQKPQQLYNYFKFLKLVPHVFVDATETGHERDYQTWSYSLTQNKKENSEIRSQQIKMTFEFSPLTMQITRQNNQLSKFLINLCGIVGGVFIVFGMANSVMLQFVKGARGE